MLYEVNDSISDKETMETDPPKSQKRKHPSSYEKIPVKKGLVSSENTQSESSTTSSITPASPNSMENNHFRFRSTDIGPFNIMISIRKKNIKEGKKPPSNTTVARPTTLLIILSSLNPCSPQKSLGTWLIDVLSLMALLLNQMKKKS